MIAMKKKQKRVADSAPLMNSWRLLNRDGSFNVERPRWQGGLKYRDLYHSLLAMGWWRFLGLLAGVYYAINLLFAGVFLACGTGALEGMRGVTHWERYLEAFFFSVQTFATIGYGRLNPTTALANFLVTFEALIGLLSVALATGLLFARFSRPTARVIFSKVALISRHDGEQVLMFRVANARLNQIVDADMTVVFSRTERTKEGEVYRNFYTLNLERRRSPIFALSWTVVHPIDQDSPLQGVTEEVFRESDAELIVSMTGIDDTFAQTIHSRFSYKPTEVVWNRAFEDILSRTPEGLLRIDLARIHDLKPSV